MGSGQKVGHGVVVIQAVQQPQEGPGVQGDQLTGGDLGGGPKR